MSPQGPPGDRAADEGSRAAGARFPAQPCPTDQSVLWRPAVQELARPDSDATLIFVAQRALAAVEDHLLSAPHQALLGYLVGRLFESPGSGLPYLVVHGAVRVPQMIVADATERVVAQSLGAVQRMLPPEDGVVVGWYRSDPTGALKISASDHAAHTHHFPRPWQIALLLTSGPAAARGGFFRPAGDPRSAVPYLPFYELLDPENYRDGAKQPRVSWNNYWSPDPAVWRAHAEPPHGAEPPRAPRVTPSERPSGARRAKPLLMDEEEDDYSKRRPPRGGGRGPWGWWIVACGAVVGAVALGVRLGLRPATPAGPPVETSSPAPAAAPDSIAAAAARRAVDAYQLRATLFANHQMTCADLATGLAAVDAAWLAYTLTSPAAAPGDTGVATPARGLAGDVQQVEDDFEHSGCPRP
jgi:hypothetical protein